MNNDDVGDFYLCSIPMSEWEYKCVLHCPTKKISLASGLFHPHKHIIAWAEEKRGVCVHIQVRALLYRLTL